VEGGSHETTHFHTMIAPVLHKAVSGGLTISVTNKNTSQELSIDATKYGLTDISSPVMPYLMV